MARKFELTIEVDLLYEMEVKILKRLMINEKVIIIQRM
jgi:hypothetical protein